MNKHEVGAGDLVLGLRGSVRRVVSLVPSLTEALETTAPGIVAGATAWCTHPAGLSATRVGGTKNPGVAAVRDLALTWWWPTRRRTGCAT